MGQALQPLEQFSLASSLALAQYEAPALSRGRVGFSHGEFAPALSPWTI